MKKMLSVKLVVEIVFALLIFALVVTFQIAYTFDYGKVYDSAFWFQVVAQWTTTMILYNVFYNIDNTNRRADKNTRYYYVMATNRLRIDKILSERRYEELQKALDKRNRETLVKQCNKLLHKYTCKLNYDDVNTLANGEMGKLKEQFCINGLRWKMLRRTILKVQQGKVRYEAVTPDVLLYDRIELKNDECGMVVNSASFVLKQNLAKTISFLFCSVLMSIVSINNVHADIWYALISNFTLFVGAASSATLSSYKYINLRISVFEKRNDFLQSELGIDTEYKGT